MRTFTASASAFALVLTACSVKSEDSNAIFANLEDTGTGGACEHNGIATGDVVAVSDDEVPLLDGPDGERLINQKATDVLGETYYQQLDNTEVLRELCRTQEWSKVQVTEPAWLTEVIGWVPVAALRPIERDTSGQRRYTEEDFIWDEGTSRYKPQLVAAVNRISRENANCLTVDPGTLSRSGNRGTVQDPVFFITCNGPNDQPFNVWFEADDATSGKSFAAIPNIGRGEAVIACERAAKMAANNPQTVDFSTFMDVAFLTFPNGRSRLLSSFTAKNSFGVEGKFNIGCLFEGRELIETNISETAD